MNNRDPFNVRQGKSALSILHANAQIAASVAISASKQALSEASAASRTALSASKQALSDASIAASEAADSMSFSIPRNVPNFNDPQRRWEDAAWASSGRSRFPEHRQPSAAGAVADKIGGIFGDRKNSLPMYKDKPYDHNYGLGIRRRSCLRRWRPLLILVFIISALVYWMGWLGNSGDGSRSEEGGRLWNPFLRPEAKADWNERRDRVREAFELSWAAYEDHAWGFDEFHPASKTGRQMVNNGMGWIIVDALDTLILMNLTTQLSHAREWISTTLNYDIDHDVNTFETTIRMLGGLLSAHYLSTQFPDMAPIAIPDGSNEEDLYLEKASDLADRLLGAYESKSGIPYASINLHTMKGIPSHADMGASSTAETTTLQLEMKYLALLTGEVQYWVKAEAVMKAVDDAGARDGLVPIFIQPESGRFSGSNIRLGSRGDSYYEYLIKQYLQTSNEEPIYLDMWNEALQGVRKHLITYSKPSNLTVLGERPNGLEGELSPKMDHLVCFMPGTIALAATGGLTLSEAKKRPDWGQKNEDDMELAVQLMKTCWGMYKYTATGLSPEITYFNIYDPPHMMAQSVLQSPPDLDSSEDADWRQDYEIHAADRHNLQRPETVESLFYMWRITGEQKYRDWGWEMFQSFMKHTILEDGKGGFTSINDVTHIPPPLRDNMESFWLAETLKYFYLLFSPNDILPLTDIVFNTEAHPFPKFKLGKLFKTGWKRKPRDKDGNIVNENERRQAEEPGAATESPAS